MKTNLETNPYLDKLLRSLFRNEELVKIAYEVIDDVLNGRTTRRRYQRERNWRKDYVFLKLKKAGLITWRFDGRKNVAEPSPLLKAIIESNNDHSCEPQEKQKVNTTVMEKQKKK